MATFEQLLEAAGRAHRAGDAANARILVREAQRMRSMQPGARPQVDAATGEQMAMAPPRADAPTPATQRPDRFGDTVAAAMEGPLAMTGRFTAGLMDQSQSPTMGVLPESIPGAIRRPVAGLGDLAGAAVGALGSTFAMGAGLAGEVLGGSPTNERRLARDLMMAGAVAVPELAGVSGTIRATGRAAQSGERLARAPTPQQEAARAADDLGITPSLGMTGKTGATAAAGIERVPLAGNVIARDASRAVGEIESVFSRLRSRVGNALPTERAGAALQAGLESFVQGFRETSSRFFAEVDRRIPQDRRFRLDATEGRIAEARQAFEGNPELAQRLGLNGWDSIINEAQTGGIRWDAMKRFRTSIGEAIGNLESGRQGGALQSESLSRLKSLYGALTEDMEAAARAVGGDAYRSWSRANNHYRAGAQRIERSLDATIRPDNPERAWAAFQQLLQGDRASSDIARVRAIRQSLSADDWNTVSASVVDRLGRAPAGQQGAAGEVFSPSVFLTNWNRMDAQARRLLLPEDVRTEFDQLARVAEAAKAAGAERNFSNTGTTVGWIATLFGGSMDLGVTAGALGAGNITARALTNATFLRAVNRGARGDMRDIQRLANGNGPFAQDAQTVLRIASAEAAMGGDAANLTTAPRAVQNAR